MTNKHYIFIIAFAAFLILSGLFLWRSPAVAPENSITDKGGVALPPGSGEQVTQPETPPASVKPSPSPVSSRPAPGKNQGRVVFTMADDAPELSTLQSIILTINRVEVQNSAGTWVPVLTSVKAFDLLRLFNSAEKSMIADINLDGGTYSELRIAVSGVLVTTKSGSVSGAVLPTLELKIPVKLVVEKGGTSALDVDIMSDKALFTATDGRFVFLPVVRMDTKHSIETVQLFGEWVDFIGGAIDSSTTLGMNVNGEFIKNFSYNKYGKFEIVAGKIKVLSN